VVSYQSSESIGNTLYWVGDTGDWIDGSHWSLSSGGTPAMLLPGVSDRIIVDENSFDGVGVDQISLSQSRSIGALKWLRSSPAGIDMLGNSITVTKELVLAYESFMPVGDGSVICSASAGVGDLFFNNNELGGLKLIIDGGEWVMQGELSTGDLELSKGKLSITNSVLTLNKLNSTNATQVRELVITDSQVKLKEQSNLAAQQLTFASSGSKIIFDNAFVNLNWDGISFDGSFEVIQSEVKASGDIAIADLSIYPGSSLLLETGSTFHSDSISLLKGEDGNPVTVSCAGKSTLSVNAHFLLCTDYLNVANVDLIGSSRIYAGLNSSVVNAANWQRQACTSALFADFDVKYLCKDGFTEFKSKSIGNIDKYEWSFKDGVGVVGSSNFENPFQSFEGSGVYAVSLTVSDKLTSHTYERQIEISPTSSGKNDVAVNANELVSLATASAYQWFHNEQKIDGAVGRTYGYNGNEGVYRVVTYDGSCNRASRLVTITGLEDELHEFEVYPNPVSDNLHIEFQSPYQVKAVLTDLLGRVISTKVFNNATSISVSSLQTGFYLLKLDAGTKEIVKKIVVSR
ncbi:MAG: T9SS type A sorting domain-containing protein, partial [Cyclobacteriaceae bacterium]